MGQVIKCAEWIQEAGKAGDTADGPSRRSGDPTLRVVDLLQRLLDLVCCLPTLFPLRLRAAALILAQVCLTLGGIVCVRR